jgi:hypothetical protein
MLNVHEWQCFAGSRGEKNTCLNSKKRVLGQPMCF